MTQQNVSEQPVKKGRPSWRPARQLDVVQTNKDVRLRWVNNDPSNVQKKLAEGWEIASESDAKHRRPEGVEFGKGVGVVREYRDLVLMKMPTDMAEERNKYFRDESNQSIRTIKSGLKESVKSAKVGVYGGVTIE